ENEINYIFMRLSNTQDPEDIINLVKYLIKTNNPLSGLKLLELTDHKNSSVRKEACWGVCQLHPEIKISILIQMLSCKCEDQICFAIKKLHEINDKRCVIALIKTLKNNLNNEIISKPIIETLGSFKDLRAYKSLEKISLQPKSIIQETALASLTQYIPEASVKLCNKWLSSKNIKIREITYLSLMKTPHKKWEKIVTKHLKNEENTALKIKILSSIPDIKKYSLFKTLLNIILNETSSEAQLMAQAIFKRIKNKKILSWLLEKESHAKTKNQIVLIKLIDNYTDSKLFKFYTKKIKYNYPLAIKLIAIEQIAKIKYHQKINYLLKLIKQNTTLSYAAVISLTNCITNLQKQISIIHDILSLNPEKYPLVIQIILKFIFNINTTSKTPNNIEKNIIQLQNSSIKPIRYLAIRCMTKINIKNEQIEQLIKLSIKENDTHLKQSAWDTLIQLTNKNPEYLFIILSTLKENPNYILKSIKNTEIPKDKFKNILKHFLNETIKLQNNFPEKTQIINRYLVCIKHIILKQNSYIFSLLKNETFTKQEINLLLKIISSINPNKLQDIDLSFILEKYHISENETKKLFLITLKKIKFKDEKIEQTIFNALKTEDNTEIKKQLTDVIKGWM
ncbi:hypothetical protein KKC59_03840, partial [bacterium]|nr:hypothetical protein [bacterium]